MAFHRLGFLSQQVILVLCLCNSMQAGPLILDRLANVDMQSAAQHAETPLPKTQDLIKESLEKNFHRAVKDLNVKLNPVNRISTKVDQAAYGLLNTLVADIQKTIDQVRGKLQHAENKLKTFSEKVESLKPGDRSAVDSTSYGFEPSVDGGDRDAILMKRSVPAATATDDESLDSDEENDEEAETHNNGDEAAKEETDSGDGNGDQTEPAIQGVVIGQIVRNVDHVSRSVEIITERLTELDFDPSAGVGCSMRNVRSPQVESTETNDDNEMSESKQSEESGDLQPEASDSFPFNMMTGGVKRLAENTQPSEGTVSGLTSMLTAPNPMFDGFTQTAAGLASGLSNPNPIFEGFKGKADTSPIEMVKGAVTNPASPLNPVAHIHKFVEEAKDDIETMGQNAKEAIGSGFGHRKARDAQGSQTENRPSGTSSGTGLPTGVMNEEELRMLEELYPKEFGNQPNQPPVINRYRG